MKRLLGHELDKNMMEKARKQGEILPDFSKKRFDNIRVKMGDVNEPGTIDIASDSEDTIILSDNEDDTIIESNDYKNRNKVKD